MSANTAQFKSHKFLNLETVRKCGVTVATPVWFVEHDGKFYVRTVSDAGKVKRIRNNGQVRIMPCGQRGEPKGDWIKATARLTQYGVRFDRPEAASVTVPYGNVLSMEHDG